MSRARFCLVVLITLGMIVFACQRVAAAERQGPVKIGALNEGWGPTPATIGLRDGLLALGYREGEQFTIGVRFTQGDVGALPAAARELVRAGADIIFATTTNAVKAAQAATTETPIVFSEVVGDVTGLGIVRSFARPGGNVTGVTNLDLELNAKRLELFKDIVSGLKRVLFPYVANDPYAAAHAQAYRDAARELGIVLVEKAVRTPEGHRPAGLGKPAGSHARPGVARGTRRDALDAFRPAQSYPRKVSAGLSRPCRLNRSSRSAGESAKSSRAAYSGRTKRSSTAWLSRRRSPSQ